MIHLRPENIDHHQLDALSLEMWMRKAFVCMKTERMIRVLHFFQSLRSTKPNRSNETIYYTHTQFNTTDRNYALVLRIQIIPYQRLQIDDKSSVGSYRLLSGFAFCFLLKNAIWTYNEIIIKFHGQNLNIRVNVGLNEWECYMEYQDESSFPTLTYV